LFLLESSPQNKVIEKFLSLQKLEQKLQHLHPPS